MSEANPAQSRNLHPCALRLYRIPFWMLCIGLTSLACWLPLVLLGSNHDFAAAAHASQEFAPVFLGLGIAFTVYGMGYHVALNIVHWREIREDDHDDMAVFCGRKRFERRKKKHTRLPAQRPKLTAEEEEEEGCFDDLD